MKLKLDKKTIKNMLILGIILVAGVVPICRTLLTRFPRALGTKTISEDSNADITEAYAFPFSISGSGKIHVKFSLNYANTSATIIFAARGDYNEQYAAVGGPTSVSELDFIRCLPEYGNMNLAGQTQTVNSYTINTDGSVIIEFAGDTDGGDNLIIVPGKYVLIIYGTNTGTSTNVKFDIQIFSEIPGRQIARIAAIVGWALIAIACAVLVFNFMKKPFEGRP